MTGAHAHPDLAEAAAVESLAVRVLGLEVTAREHAARIDALAAPAAPPGPTTTGARGPLSARSGTITVTTPGTVLEGLDLAGRVRVRAADVTIRNCRITGGTGGNATMIEAWDAACVRLLVEDCTIAPTSPGVLSQGIHGHDYTARRLDVSRVVDGFGAFNRVDLSARANVLIEGCWVHDLHCWTPDPNHSDGITHNDCVQVHGNGGVTVRGNLLLAMPGGSSHPSVGGMSCVMVTPGVAPAPDVLIEGNWLDGGSAVLNLNRRDAGDTVTSVRVVGNRFGRWGTRSAGRDESVETYRILAGRGLSVQADGNVYADDGSPVPVRAA